MTLAALVQPGPKRKKQKQPGVLGAPPPGSPLGLSPPPPQQALGWEEVGREAEGWSSLLLTLRDEELGPVLPQTVGNGAAESCAGRRAWGCLFFSVGFYIPPYKC